VFRMHYPRPDIIPVVGPIKRLLVGLLQDKRHSSSDQRNEIRSSPPVVELDPLLLRHSSVLEHYLVYRACRARFDQAPIS